MVASYILLQTCFFSYHNATCRCSPEWKPMSRSFHPNYKCAILNDTGRGRQTWDKTWTALLSPISLTYFDNIALHLFQWSPALNFYVLWKRGSEFPVKLKLLGWKLSGNNERKYISLRGRHEIGLASHLNFLLDCCINGNSASRHHLSGKDDGMLTL